MFTGSYRRALDDKHRLPLPKPLRDSIPDGVRYFLTPGLDGCLALYPETEFAALAERLAACVNVLPGVRSFYHWKGEIESSQEFLLLVKTSRDLFPALRTEIERLHPYELPEVIALPVVAGSDNYLTWLQANLRGASE